MVLKKLICEKNVEECINNKKQNMKLEYYIVEEKFGTHEKIYGIEIINKSKINNEIYMENKIIKGISCIKSYVENTAKVLAENLVTPVTIKDILMDRLGI